MASVLEGLVESYTDEGRVTYATWPEAIVTLSAGTASGASFLDWICSFAPCEGVTAEVGGVAAEIGGAVGMDVLRSGRE